jgi:hypothetical protein
MCEFAQTTDRGMREAFSRVSLNWFVRDAARKRKYDELRLDEGYRAGSPHRRSVAGASEMAADR